MLSCQVKTGSNNSRASTIKRVMKGIKAEGIEVVVFEPMLKGAEFFRSPEITDLNDFKQTCDVILANRMVPELADVAEKVYTRDIFGSD